MVILASELTPETGVLRVHQLVDDLLHDQSRVLLVSAALRFVQSTACPLHLA